MTTPQLSALFQPQRWIHDVAIDSEPAFEFEVGEILLSLPVDRFKYAVGQAYRDFGRDLDEIAEKAGLVGDASDQHDGPFQVEIDSYDLDMFLEEIGVENYKKLTATEWDQIRFQFIEPELNTSGLKR